MNNWKQMIGGLALMIIVSTLPLGVVSVFWAITTITDGSV
jgi:hypothetical protein